MSLITQCPACSTLFKVVPDQLRVSQGWVRCGQCDEVFDANVHMRNGSAEPAVSTPPEEEFAQQFEQTPHQSLMASEDDSFQGTSAQKGSETDRATDLEEASAQEPQEIAPAYGLGEDVNAGSNNGSDYDWGGVVAGPLVPAAEPDQAVDAFLERSPNELLVPHTDAHLRAEAAPGHVGTASFMATREPRPAQAKGARVVWSAALVLLIVGAAVQVLVHQRDRLAAVQPALKPALVSLCEWASCTVRAFQQIDAIVIDSSSFAKVQHDVYKLSVTLKNTASMEIAKPALELTLTDSQDQALLRRVILPAELEDQKPSLAAGEEVSWAIPIAVKTAEGSVRIAGYRVLAFYP